VNGGEERGDMRFVREGKACGEEEREEGRSI
jgi:hypothetical protein